MITVSEFTYLANRSDAIFQRIMLGSSLNQAIHNKRAWEVATTAYARLHPGNGQVDEVQARALAHAAQLYKNLWKLFRRLECRLHQVAFFNGQGRVERKDKCATHGEVVYCHKQFEDRMKLVSY